MWETKRESQRKAKKHTTHINPIFYKN